MKKTHNKLVRDKIIDIIKSDDRIPVYHQLTKEEFWQELLKKDTEELEEVRSSKTTMEMKEELADKFEILLAMAAYHHISFQDVIEEADRKRKLRGGFRNRIFLEKVE